MIERAGQGCAIETALFERISQPYAREGRALASGWPKEVRHMGMSGD